MCVNIIFFRGASTQVVKNLFEMVRKEQRSSAKLAELIAEAEKGHPKVEQEAFTEVARELCCKKSI